MKKKKKKTPTHFWNYRVISKKIDIPNFTPFSEHEETPEEVEESFEIHEVYYSNGEPTSCSENPIKPYGSTKKDLKKELRRMLDALDKPVIPYSHFDKDGG